MRYGKAAAWVLTAVFLAAALVIGAMDAPPAAEPEGLALSAVIGPGEERLSCWERKPGEYYLFLPAYASLSKTLLVWDGPGEISIGEQTLKDHLSCGDFRTDTAYPLSGGALEEPGTLTLLRSANLPALHLDVRSGSMDFIHQEKGNQEPGSLRVYSPEGVLEYSGPLESLSARGNITWERNHDKKPYSLNLTAEADLLGMGTAKRWILQSNAFDSSNLRNKAVFDFAKELGLAYSPDTRWVDLYLNGEYAGLYLLSERNEIHPERVAAGSGSTLVSIDMAERMERQGEAYIPVDGDTALRLHSGQKVTEELTAFWCSVDNAIQAEDGIDPVTGRHYLTCIDLDSWVRKYLIEEVFGNVEASAVSHYFYIDGNDESKKIYAGPVWDYDFALGSHWTWQTDNVQSLFCARPYVWDEGDTPWFYALWQKEEFRAQVIALYESEFRPRMLTLLDTTLEEYAGTIQASAKMNQRRWDTGSAGEETAYIREFLGQRLAFLDSLWLTGDTYYTVTANKTDGSVVSCYALRPGETVPPLPQEEADGDVIGWYDYDTGEAFDETAPIYESKRVYLKREEAPPVQEGTARLIIRYAPMGGLLLMLAAIVLLDRSRRKGMEIPRHERTNPTEISP